MANVLWNSGGTYVEWYQDDDNNSGYGDNPRCAIWYANLDECYRLSQNKNPPRGTEWIPIKSWTPDMSPGSAAWCEGYGDIND